jgi:HEAT repeats
VKSWLDIRFATEHLRRDKANLGHRKQWHVKTRSLAESNPKGGFKMRKVLKMLDPRLLWLYLLLAHERRQFFQFGEPILPDRLREMIIWGGFPTIGAVFERLRTGGANLFLVSVLTEMAKSRDDRTLNAIEKGATAILTDKELKREEWIVEAMIGLLKLVEMMPEDELSVLINALVLDPFTAPEMLVERINALLEPDLHHFVIRLIFDELQTTANPYLIDVLKELAKNADATTRVSISVEVGTVLQTLSLRKEHWLMLAMLELLMELHLETEVEGRLLLASAKQEPKTVARELLILLGVFTENDSPWLDEMLTALKDETDEELQRAMSEAFFAGVDAAVKGRPAIAEVAVSAKSKTVRANLARVLGGAKEGTTVSTLSRLMIQDNEPEVRFAALVALKEQGEDLTVYLLLLFDVLHKADPALQELAAFFISGLGSSAIDPLLGVLVTRRRSVRSGALAAKILLRIFQNSRDFLGPYYYTWSGSFFEQVLDCFARATAQSAPILCDVAATIGSVWDLCEFRLRKPFAPATEYFPFILARMISGVAC